jgi:mannose-1-phosphate guanylyltransferase/phosphomannomutase
MFSVAKLLEMLTIQERSLAQVRAELPRIYNKSTAVRCPWKVKGYSDALSGGNSRYR